MATVTVASIVTAVQTIMQDATGIRWPETEVLNWINDGQREIVLYKPNAFVKNVPVALVQGSKQSLPSDGVQLIDVPRNMGAGATPGRAIRITMREVLDSQIPGWHSSAPVNEIKHYMYSMLDPKTYYVYPPAQAGIFIDIVYGAAPNDATLGGFITIDDIYKTILIDYALYRAYSKDTEFSADPSRSSSHQAAYIGALTGKARVEAAANPNAMSPANPNVTPNSR